VISARVIQSALLTPLVESHRPEVGPFVVLLDGSSTSPYRNYAVPRPGLTPTAAQVQELIALFAQRSLRGRLEYVEPNDPVTAALVAEGFEISQRLPLMALGTLSMPGPIDGIEIAAAFDEEELLGAATVMGIAYGDTEPAEQGADRLRGTITSGGSVSIARDTATGRIVSGGLHSALTSVEDHLLCELAAVATLPEYRRRGIAAAVSAHTAAHAVRQGADVFLQAEGEAEAAIYGRIGFDRVGSLALVDGPELSAAG
jgi:ribosomal protein S18 acetylase RimI-like enzyme